MNSPGTEPSVLRFAEFDLDEANASLLRAGQSVSLPPKAFAVLCHLARQPRQLVRKNDLLDAVWGHRHVSESVLKTTVSQIRAALGDDSAQPRFIETVSRHGYRFVGVMTSLSSTHDLADAVSVNDHHAIATAAPIAPLTLIGREFALTRLRSAWSRVCKGEHEAIWVAGEAGVGKTSLIKYFVAELPAAAIAWGHCVEHYGSGEPCLPILEALRELATRQPRLPALMRDVAPTWAVQMPWLVNAAERTELFREIAGVHPDRMVRELLELLSRLSAEQPLLLVTEDLHWSDPTTLRILDHFARQQRKLPVLWLSSFRLAQVIAEQHPLAGLRHELRLHRHCEELLLDSFSEHEVAAYLNSRMPGSGTHEALVHRIHHHTEGLPLFVANVADHLLAQLDLASDNTAEQLTAAESQPLPVPDSLSGVIEKQLRRQSMEVQAMLGAASVCGVEFRASLLAALLDRDVDIVQSQCDELVSRQYWLRHVDIIELPNGDFDSRYEFVHALYQRVLYQCLPVPVRVKYHRAYARVLLSGESSDVLAAEVASHYERGHDSLSAMRWYAAAAQAALGRFAPIAAAQLAEKGLSLVDKLPMSAERLVAEFDLIRPCGAAAALVKGVASPEAEACSRRAYTLYESLPPSPQHAIGLNGLGWLHYVRGEFQTALDLATRLAAIAEQHNDPVLRVFGYNLSGVSLVNRGELVAGCAALARGIELCAGISDSLPLNGFIIDPECSMHFNIAYPLIDLGEFDRARRHLAQGIARAERIRQPMSMMLSHWTGGMLAVRIDDIDAVKHHADAVAQIVEQAMLSQGEGPALWLRGWVTAMQGNGREGHDLIMRGFDCHARLGMYAGCTEVLTYACSALIQAKDWQGAQQRLADARALAKKIGEDLVAPRLDMLAGEIALATEGHETARVYFKSALWLAREQQARGMELRLLVMLVELEGSGDEDVEALRGCYLSVDGGKDLGVYMRAAEVLTTHS